jgi:hypothetical protein
MVPSLNPLGWLCSTGPHHNHESRIGSHLMNDDRRNVSNPTAYVAATCVEAPALYPSELETGNPARKTAVNHSDVLIKPMDARADVHAFLSECSKVLDLRMSGLPHDTTQSELEGWFTRFGGRRIAFWTRKQQVAFP